MDFGLEVERRSRGLQVEEKGCTQLFCVHAESVEARSG